jgi:hypothetical protein
MDILAPGAIITGANASGGLASYTGTSQASPHIAGLAVLAQQLAVQQMGRRLTPAEFRTLLRDSAAGVYDGDNENDNVANSYADYSRADAAALGQAILDMADGVYQYGYSVTLAADEVRSSVSFGDQTTDLRPGAPQLTTDSDTGVSSSDRLTKLDNSSLANRLVFSVSGTLPGADVSLYADGALIGAVTATASMTLITTSGSRDLADGAHVITARQAVAGLPQSADSDPLAISVDPYAPFRPVTYFSSQTGRDGSYTNLTRPHISFRDVEYYRIYRDGYLVSGLWEFAESGEGGYSMPNTADGLHRFTVISVDAAGNESAAAECSGVVDTIPPAPSSPSLPTP